jgi:epoxyqueuosine reductase QueG
MAKKKKVVRKTEINSEKVKEYGINAGATVLGIATSEDFSLAPKGFKPTDALKGCQSVIVLGIPFPKEAFENSVEYTKVRNAMSKKMTAIAKELAKQIKNDGYKTKAISSIGGKYVNGEHFGIISLKHAAQLAGIGLITRNYLLTNLEYGNRLWFSSVLTDAQLIPDKKIELDICKGCDKCVESCPSGALDKPSSLEKKECSKYYKMVNRKLEIRCFLCRTVCPYGFGEKD